MHMYLARKTVLKNREITLILKREMSFATETRLGNRPLLSRPEPASYKTYPVDPSPF